MLKITSSFFLALIFIGCSSDKEIIYIDANGTAINHKPQYETINPPIVCDTRGFAYYKLRGYSALGIDYSLTPIMFNTTYGARQVECKDL